MCCHLHSLRRPMSPQSHHFDCSEGTVAARDLDHSFCKLLCDGCAVTSTVCVAPCHNRAIIFDCSEGATDALSPPWRASPHVTTEPSFLIAAKAPLELEI